MDPNKRLTDPEILLQIINAVRLTKNGFATKCKYKSAMSIYNVLEGRNGISDDMAARITQTFPEVNYKFIITGEGEVLNAEVSPVQRPIYPNTNDKPKGTLEDFASVPDTLLRIEKLLEELLKKY
ncbi:hypothetical protein CXF59_04950 [Flavobacterium sp. ALD4]|uniref:hypothetical protein n=1 Tax=Flavobacterium sp. ALD4 TaxID=2058314 RepID=UPI000C33893B|nr:hypothetical protein [Flavobacterium sp. ALD4]PKH68149.1 hypothetical protein CXF59_04950 [Flavobacterium sp. ALD4]